MARLTVPLDAAGIDDLDPKQPIKVVLASGERPLESRTITLDTKGGAAVSFDFERAASGLRVLVGPPDATDEEMLGLQTLGVDVPLRRFLGRDELVIPPLRITPYYWFWWLRWCRTFTVRGRVLCGDGRPVPGAVVCAYDVDAWWWWWSRQQLGCATTDANGSFTLSFRWCCGWWPWWWWAQRHWELEPWLAHHLLKGLQRELVFPKIPLPDPAPDLRIFEQLLGESEALPFAAQAMAHGRLQHAPLMREARGYLPVARQAAALIQPERLEGLRQRLASRLPAIAELSALRLWPWAPWQPWWDCTPDLVFRATQQCGGEERVIVDEGWSDARWNAPTELDLTLTANASACCVSGNDCLEGHCLALTQACDVDIDDIGGNPGAAPMTPIGYAHPDAPGNAADAPFAGLVMIRGTVPCLSGVDYYEIEYSADSGSTWLAVPASALGSFVRKYWDFDLGHDVDVYFSPTAPMDGHHLYETVAHYEAGHTPGDWGASKVWLGTNIDVVFPWLTAGTFSDGTYMLRVRGYQQAADGHVTGDDDALKVCETDVEATIVVTLDNQSTYLPPGPADNPCGPGTTHACTNEPMTDILEVRIIKADGSTQAAGPCGQVQVGRGDVLEVDFIAYDAQGHLASFDLIATFGENESVPLTALGGAAALSPLPGAPVPAAAQVGPDYAGARSQGATGPSWAGGAMRFSLPALQAFERTCCYQLELRAYKRTIVNCQENFAHRNLSERSFLVMV
jgi:hypothetical protein